MDAKTVKSIVFTAADGIAYVYPVAAPLVAVIEKIVNLLDDSGAFPQVLSAEQQTAMIAGMAAARASAVTSYRGIPTKEQARAELARRGRPVTGDFDDLPHDVFATLKKE